MERLKSNDSPDRSGLDRLSWSFIEAEREERKEAEDLLHASVVDGWRNKTKLKRHLTDSRESWNRSYFSRDVSSGNVNRRIVARKVVKERRGERKLG